MYIEDSLRLRAVTVSPPEKMVCFVCGLALKPPLIFWLGRDSGRDLFLHPSCTARLVLRLARDTQEHISRTGEDLALSGSGGKAVLRGR